MNDCKHDQIQTWRLESGEPAGLWSCVECNRKFEPINLALEADAARLAHIYSKLDWDNYGYWLPEFCVKEGDERPTMDEFRAALDAVRDARA